MSRSHPIGLGEPEPVGKKSLFQPPVLEGGKNIKSQKPESENNLGNPKRRIRSTFELTYQAIVVLQEIQNRYRLETGKVLPLWKLVSQAIESYGRKISNNPTLHPEPALHAPDGKRKV